MLKCLAFICLIGLAVSNPDWDSAQAGKKSQRMNLLSKTVGARMLAGTNGQMDTGFQPMTNTGNQFVPIPRQTNAAMGSMQQQQPLTGGQTMDNSLNNGQQLTPEQLQQLHQFLTAQTQSQQQQQSQFTPSQQRTVATQQQQQQPQPVQQMTQQQPQQTFRMTDTTGMNPTGMSGVNPTTTTGTGMDTSMFGDQQTAMNNQFGQGRMMNPSVATAFPTTTPFTTPSLSKPATPMGMGMMPTASQTQGANKPSALEQQLLDQQILTQKLKEQLLQQQQQQQKMTQQQQGKFQQQPTQTQPITPDQTTMAGFGGLGQATEQLTQEQKLQRMTQQQQQQQQQQLLDQINQLNKMNQQQQGRNTQTPGVQTQTPGFQQQTPTGAVPTTGTQTPGSFQTPVTQTPGFGGMQQPMMPTNTSRMMMNNQMRPTPTGMSFGGKGRVGGGDICSGAQPGELMAHPLDETQFIVCNELGEITLMDCPNHTVFNPHLKLCDLTSEMPLLCKANPCLNGAKCVEVSPIQFRCECPQGFSGKTCEKFDTCQSSKPCGSDGVCLSFALGSPIPHVCLCNGGRTVGLTCAQGEQNPCTFPGSSTKLMPVNFNRAVFAHCEGARPHFKFCQPPLLFSGSKQACEWTH